MLQFYFKEVSFLLGRQWNALHPLALHHLTAVPLTSICLNFRGQKFLLFWRDSILAAHSHISTPNIKIPTIPWHNYFWCYENLTTFASVSVVVFCQLNEYWFDLIWFKFLSEKVRLQQYDVCFKICLNLQKCVCLMSTESCVINSLLYTMVVISIATKWRASGTDDDILSIFLSLGSSKKFEIMLNPMRMTLLKTMRLH